MSTSIVCLPLDIGLGTKPEQNCRRFTKYEAEICYLHLSHPSPLLFLISHPSSPYNYRRSSAALGENGGKWEIEALCWCSGKESWFQSLEKSLSSQFQHGGCRCSCCTIRCNPLSSFSYALSLQICLVSHLRHEFAFKTLEEELKWSRRTHILLLWFKVAIFPVVKLLWSWYRDGGRRVSVCRALFSGYEIHFWRQEAVYERWGIW